MIIIVTAFDQHAIQAFEAGAVNYLLKPISAERLEKAVERAKRILERPVEIERQVAKIAAVSTPYYPIRDRMQHCNLAIAAPSGRREAR